MVRRTETVPRDTDADASAALQRASEAGQTAREFSEQCKKERQELEAMVPSSSAQENFRESRLNDLMSAQQHSLKEAEKAVAIESGISAVQKAAAKMGDLKQGLRSLLPNSPQRQIRDLNSHTSDIRTRIDVL